MQQAEPVFPHGKAADLNEIFSRSMEMEDCGQLW